MLAEPGAGELQRARVRHPQRGERQQRGRGHRREAVVQHAEPGVELAQFLPPLDLDRVAANGAHAEQEEQQKDEQRDAGRRRTAAGRNFIPGHVLSVAPDSGLAKYTVSQIAPIRAPIVGSRETRLPRPPRKCCACIGGQAVSPATPACVSRLFGTF